jgi:hypothetical protein
MLCSVWLEAKDGKREAETTSNLTGSRGEVGVIASSGLPTTRGSHKHLSVALICRTLYVSSCGGDRLSKSAPPVWVIVGGDKLCVSLLSCRAVCPPQCV